MPVSLIFAAPPGISQAGKNYVFINSDRLTVLKKYGGLAQLARAFAWHAKGHRFDSGNLHQSPAAWRDFFSSGCQVKVNNPENAAECIHF